MRRLLAVVLGIALGVGLVVVLAELTQNRPDIVDLGTASQIRYRVETRGYDEDLAAIGLWAACQQVVDERVPDRMPSGDGSAGPRRARPAAADRLPRGRHDRPRPRQRRLHHPARRRRLDSVTEW
jgi:hypothetical protein